MSAAENIMFFPYMSLLIHVALHNSCRMLRLLEYSKLGVLSSGHFNPCAKGPTAYIIVRLDIELL
jgi:hypothetical protein